MGADAIQRRDKMNTNRKMKEILSADFVKDCGDATSIYNCKLLKDDVTVREFWEAVKDSCDKKNGNVFYEWWANFNISFEGKSSFETVVDIDYMGDGSIRSFDYRHDVEKDMLEKYGSRIVTGCRWNGGWGAGGYSVKIKFNPEKDTTT